MSESTSPAALIADVRSRHGASDNGRRCHACGELWPCEVTQVTDALEAATRQPEAIPDEGAYVRMSSELVSTLADWSAPVQVRIERANGRELHLAVRVPDLVRVDGGR